MYCLLCTSFELCSWEHVLLMVDYDECEWSLCSLYALLLSLLSWCGRGSFFEVQALIMLLLRCSLRDGQQVPGASIPHGGSFVLFRECPKYCGDRKRTVQSYFPPFMRVRWLEKSAHISRFTWHCTLAPQCCGAKWHRQVCIGKGFFDDTDGFFDRCRMGGAKQHR